MKPARSEPDARPERRYLSMPAPIDFPAEEKMPETRRHFELRTALFQMLQAAFGDRAVIGSDQFVYWDAANPRVCCAPDVMLRFGERDATFDLWKVWERGAPQLAIEVLSKSDKDILSFEIKLQRYRSMGVVELVCFDFDAPERHLRIWDRLERGDLSERDPADPGFTRSEVVPGYWWVSPSEAAARALRLARDPEGKAFYLTPAELAQAAREQAEAEREQAEAEREQAEAARERAQARVATLEAELARLRNE